MLRMLNVLGSNVVSVLILAATALLVGRMTDDKRGPDLEHIVLNAAVLKLAYEFVFHAPPSASPRASHPATLAQPRIDVWTDIKMPELDTTPLKEAKLPIVWVLGGPGSGKGTLCDKIVSTFGFTHVSTGDLLRADVQSGSERGKALDAIMKRGELVPTNVVLHLLAEKMISLVKTSKGFLIDGYPRELDQGKQFEETIQPCSVVLYLEANDDIMVERLLNRGKTSGRADDNEETIKKRLNTFHTHNDPIVQYYEGKTKKISAHNTPECVFEEAKGVLEDLIKA